MQPHTAAAVQVVLPPLIPAPSIPDFPDVANVCRQALKELWRDGAASLAHVTMQPGAASLLHRHSRLTEVYLILEGSGELLVDDRRYVVSKDSVVVIPPGAAHKLINSPDGALTHYVICTPPFDPVDVSLLEEAPQDA